MRALGVVVFMLSTTGRAEDRCVEVTQRLNTRSLELWASLRGCLDVTVTVSTDDRTNVSAALPETVSSGGRPRFLLARWTQADPNQPWRVGAWRYRWKLGRPLRSVPVASGPWRLPFAGEFKQLQGPHGTFSHGPGSQDEEAIDWAMPEGTEVLAARDGVVVGVRSDCTDGAAEEALRGEANYVILRHADGTYSEYYHLQPGGVRTRLGATVTAGERLGLSGNTGFTSEPHLHFSVFHALDGTRRETLPVTFTP